MEITEQIQERAEQLQEEANKLVGDLFPKVKAISTGWQTFFSLISGRRDRLNACEKVWLLNRIAELELRIEKLEEDSHNHKTHPGQY